MIKISIFLCVALVVLVSAEYGSHYEDHYEHHEPHYQFEYSVHDPHTHDIKSQQESRDGDVLKGYYTVKEADGSTREVRYTADHKNGFNAVVSKDGQQVFPHIPSHHELTGHY